MNDSLLFEKLEQYALSHTRFTASPSSDDDFREQYIQVLNKKGYSEGDYIFDEYMELVDTAKYKIEKFIKRCPLPFAIIAFRNDLMRRYFQYDVRDPDSEIYTSDVVLFAVIWSSLCGGKTCKDHAQFWFDNNPLLQYLIPGMPSPKWMISAETIRFFLKMIPDGEFSSMFKQYFGDKKIKAEELLENIKAASFDEDEAPQNQYRHLIGGDGQELRSSYRRGDHNRKDKGAQRVSCYDCDARVVLNYILVKCKNNERNAFMTMLSDMYVPSDCIFYADAINSSKEMIEFLNRMMMDWIFAIKNNLSNSVAVVAIKNYLNEHKDTYEYFHCEKVDKTGARIEVRRYDIIPISAVEPCQQALLKPGTKTLIRVEKETYSHLKDDNKNIKEEKMTESKPTVSTLYFISSLDYNEDNCKQIVHSLRSRWLYESQHNTLDTVMLQDSQHCCDENHLAAITGLNSMVYNIVSFARQKMSTRGYTNVAHRNADTAMRAPLITYSRVFSIFKQHPLVAIQYLDEYFNTPPVED